MSSKEETKGRSSIAPTGSKTGHIKRKKESSSIMDSNPSQTSASTIVVAEMHKEDQQATGDPKSLGCMDKGTKNTSFDHISTGKRASSIARQVKEEEASRTIKLEDQAKLMSQVQLSFKDLDSPEYDPIIVVVNSDEDEEANKDIVYTATNAETKDASVPKSLSLRSSQIQELTNQVLILYSQKYKLEIEKNKAKAKAALLSQAGTQPDKEEKNTNQATISQEDGISEVIPNFKASDLHLDKWREVMNACPNRIEKGWKTIYGHIRSRMDYIHITKAKLGIKLDIPLSKQDPLAKLNDLTNKKRKHADDINDYFKANKRLKSSVQYKDHLPGIVLNEHVLGPRLDDHARTFISLLLVEVDKRNQNPLKQMRTIK
nr:hypothetical protein [Tanacetum cinerariifolium]